MALAVVQAAATAANAASTQPKTNWGAAPTNGNLLIAAGYLRNGTTPTGVNGWKVFSTTATSNWNLVVYYKYAASAPQVEGVDAGTTYAEWGLSFWEISGVSGTLWKDLQKVSFGGQNGSSSSLAAGNDVTTGVSTLVLSMFAGQFGANTTTTNWTANTGWTHDADFVASVGDGFGVFNWASGGHRAVTAGSTVSSTITTSANATAWMSLYVELGFNNGPAIDTASVVSAVTTPGVNTAITTQASPTFTEATVPCVIVAIVNAGCFENASPPTPPFTTGVSGLGLTWNLRGRKTYNAGSQTQQEMTVWWAEATSAVSGVVTAAISGLSGSNNFFAVSGIQVFAVLGLANPSSPWDSNAALPDFGLPNGSLTTSSDPDLVISSMVTTVANNQTLPTAVGLAFTPFAFSQHSNGGGAVIQNCGTSWAYATTTESALAITGTGGSGQTIAYVDAFGPGAPSVVNGVGQGTMGGPISLTAMTGAAIGDKSVLGSGTMGGPITIPPMTGIAVVVNPPPPPPPPAPLPPFPFGLAQTLLLDQLTWDVTVDIDGNIAIASLPYSAVQDACSAIRCFLGELWYDTSQGIPYLTAVFGQQPSLSFLKAAFANAALTVPAVASAQAFITGLANRTLTGQVQLTLVDGSTAVVGFVTDPTQPRAFIVGHSQLSGGDVTG